VWPRAPPLSQLENLATLRETVCQYAGIIGRYAARRSAVRGCGFVVSRGLALRGGLIFSHPMPLGIGHQFYGFVDAFFHRALGIKYLVS